MSASSEHLEDTEHLEHIAHLVHDIPAHVPAARAKAATLLLIISDALSVTAILASGGYLSALNVSGQFVIAGDHAPTFLPGLLLAIALVLSGLAYYWWEQRVRKNDGAGQSTFFILALVLMIVAMVGQFWLSATTGYGAPFHAYESLILLLSWFSAIHLLLAAIVGLLLIGRIVQGRLIGHAYIAEAAGYWWYYTVISTLVLWIFSLLIV